MGFYPTDDIVRVVIDKTAKFFSMSGATGTVGIDISTELYLEPC